MDNPQAGIEFLVENTNQIIEFINALGFQDEALSTMVAQLQQLNTIASQIHELNGLGRNLGYIVCDSIDSGWDTSLHQEFSSYKLQS